MSRVCAICGKGQSTGNNVTFSHRGIRRTWSPNLRRVRVYDENGTPKRIKVCTRCLRSGKVNRNKPLKHVMNENNPVEEIAEDKESPVEEAEDQAE